MSSTPLGKRAALYIRVSTADRGQTVENQLRPLQEAAARLGWTIVAIHSDEGASGAKGRAQRPGLDALLRGVTRREFDIVAAWSVCRLGRSLPDLIGLLGELVVREKASLRHASTHSIAHRGMAGSTAATIRTLMRRRRPASAARTQAQSSLSQ